MDVFDTVLIRASGTPEALMLWLGRKLWLDGVIACTPEVFARTRIAAERAVWARAGWLDSHTHLEHFYQEVARRLFLEPELISHLVSQESALEHRYLCCNPLAQQILDQAASNHSRVVYVSDTYHSSRWLKDVLKANGLCDRNSGVFSSSDLAKSKVSGRIFSHVSDEYQLPPQSFLHVGDHEHSDVAAPNREGFKSFHLSDARLNRYESVLVDEVWGSSGLSAAMAGASRLARLSCAAVQSHADRQALIDVAAGVASPILVGYVLWILRRAQVRGIDRLYFLSRDGQVLFEIARILSERLGISIEPRYLYVSRLSANLAGTFEASDEELSWVLRDAPNATIEQSLRPLDIEWEEVAHLMRDCGFLSPDEILTAQRTVGFGTALQTDGLRQIILEKAHSRRQLVSAYLAQEGVLERPVGLVDFGGVGSQMRALHSLVRAAGGPGPILYVVGLDNPGDAGLSLPATTPAWLTDTECYLYDHRRERGIKRFRGFGTCVQMFCAADHPTVVGYREEEGVVTPDFNGEARAAESNWDLESFREAIRLFAQHLVLDADVVDPYADIRSSACEVIRIFWAKPTKAEARIWGSFPFEGAQVSSTTTNTLARSYSWSYVVRGMSSGTFPNLGWQHWYEGSLQLSPIPLRVVLQCAENIFRRWDEASEPRWNRFARVIRRALRRQVQ